MLKESNTFAAMLYLTMSTCIAYELTDVCSLIADCSFECTSILNYFAL